MAQALPRAFPAGPRGEQMLAPPLAPARHTPLRPDIQALRGLAIVLVLLHHARAPFLPGGFLGVDIFFVISGFLMTGMIDDALEQGRFTFGDFYLRRARRLLPAAYATIAATTIAAMMLVDSVEYANLVRQVAGSLTFVANVILLQQAEYFSAGATLKPLLHMWSLSLEEQYYLGAPVLMAALARRWRLPAQLAVTAASLLLCLVFIDRNPVATFYLLPTRAWELGFGAVCALALRRGHIAARPMPLVRAMGAAVLLALPLVAGEIGHPGWPALAVCAATAVLLIPGMAPSGAPAALRPLTYIGDRSYSLYLVHWPLFAFAANIYADAVPGPVNAALVLVSLLLADLQYRFVEQRFRAFAPTRAAIATLVAVPLVTIALAAGWSAWTTTADTRVRQEAIGLSPVCQGDAAFVPDARCRSGAAPATLVWGDSFAMAAANGIAATTPGGIVQATKSECGPFLDLAPTNFLYPAAWSRKCIAFNRSVLAWLGAHPEIRVVVLSSALVQYLPGAEQQGWRMASDRHGALTVAPQRTARVAAALAETVAAVRATGRRVVLFAPPPVINYDTGRCEDRRDADLPMVSPYPGCAFPVEDYQRQARPVHAFLRGIAQARIVPVYSIVSDLCAGGPCRTRLDGTILYRDKAHLSAAGSRLLGRRMRWGAQLARIAS